LVQESVELAIAHIGRYNPELQQTLTAQVQAITTAARLPNQMIWVLSPRVVDYSKANWITAS